MLAGSPGLERWTGNAVFHESRDRAGAMVKELAKAARSEIRWQPVTNLIEKLPR